ncbi:MAG: hypothetical protein PHV68_03230 [Candidatus Gastranaerophilales bacterium]|nr:hypothetical protein [Candidatus Gastranaerophilales bacterium]
MQNTENMTSELNFAICSIEKILNNADGEFIINVIKQYKQNGDLEPVTLQKLKLELNKQVVYE